MARPIPRDAPVIRTARSLMPHAGSCALSAHLRPVRSLAPRPADPADPSWGTPAGPGSGSAGRLRRAVGRDGRPGPVLRRDELEYELAGWQLDPDPDRLWFFRLPPPAGPARGLRRAAA